MWKQSTTALPEALAQEGGFSSGVPKMLDAILFLLTGCSVGSSKPREKLEPPPGGRSTLWTENLYSPCQPQLPSQHITATSQVSSCQNPILALLSPLLFSGTYKNKTLSRSSCALGSIQYHTKGCSHHCEPNKKTKITMQACQIPAFLRAPWEG